MSRFNLYNPNKFKVPEKCKECGTHGSVKRIANSDDRIDLFYIKQGNQARTLINGKWTVIDSVATIVHQCTECKMRKVKWRHVKRVNEKRPITSRLFSL